MMQKESLVIRERGDLSPLSLPVDNSKPQQATGIGRGKLRFPASGKFIPDHETKRQVKQATGERIKAKIPSSDAIQKKNTERRRQYGSRTGGGSNKGKLAGVVACR
jgi:hypothetical protein